jgi:hypothetical protein
MNTQEVRMKKGVKVLLSIVLFAGIFSGFAGNKASAGDSNKVVKYSLYKPPLPPQEPPFFLRLYSCCASFRPSPNSLLQNLYLPLTSSYNWKILLYSRVGTVLLNLRKALLVRANGSKRIVPIFKLEYTKQPFISSYPSISTFLSSNQTFF